MTEKEYIKILKNFHIIDDLGPISTLYIYYEFLNFQMRVRRDTKTTSFSHDKLDSYYHDFDYFIECLSFHHNINIEIIRVYDTSLIKELHE